jgi:hypothetical protein
MMHGILNIKKRSNKYASVHISSRAISSALLDAFEEELRRVCLSVRVEQVGFHWTDFYDI